MLMMMMMIVDMLIDVMMNVDNVDVDVVVLKMKRLMMADADNN